MSTHAVSATIESWIDYINAISHDGRTTARLVTVSRIISIRVAFEARRGVDVRNGSVPDDSHHQSTKRRGNPLTVIKAHTPKRRLRMTAPFRNDGSLPALIAVLRARARRLCL